jgi:hypothetical protein
MPRRGSSRAGSFSPRRGPGCARSAHPSLDDLHRNLREERPAPVAERPKNVPSTSVEDLGAIPPPTDTGRREDLQARFPPAAVDGNPALRRPVGRPGPSGRAPLRDGRRGVPGDRLREPPLGQGCSARSDRPSRAPGPSDPLDGDVQYFSFSHLRARSGFGANDACPLDACGIIARRRGRKARRGRPRRTSARFPRGPRRRIDHGEIGRRKLLEPERVRDEVVHESTREDDLAARPRRPPPTAGSSPRTPFADWTGREAGGRTLPFPRGTARRPSRGRRPPGRRPSPSRGSRAVPPRPRKGRDGRSCRRHLRPES